MIKNYLKIVFRSIQRSKSLSLITISGLVLGMAAFAMIMQYVLFERSYDKFQSSSPDIYRIAFSIKGKDREPVSYATTFLPVASIIKDEFPEVIDYNRILYLDRHAVVTYEDKVFQQENVIYADPSFFDFFDYPLVAGDPRKVLTETNTVVISASLAEKYFGDKDPIGQFIKLNEEFNELNLMVTGIHKDIPENTHIKPKMVVSLRSVETLPETVSNMWAWPIYLNYVRLREGADPAFLESKLPEFASQHVQRANTQREYSFFLQPFSSVHLYSHLEYEIEENGSATMVYLLMVAAILILLIAYVNYINLTTAKSLSRAKEVGVRKALGSRTAQLVRQFLMEAGIFNVLAILLATGLLVSVQRYFLQFTGISFAFSAVNTPWFWFSLVSFLLIVTFLSAFYPATVLASFKPILALKGQSTKQGGSFTRKTMVMLQFAATIGLMINAYAVYIQIGLMRSKSLGVDINPILTINAPRIIEKSRVMDTVSIHEDPFKTQSLDIAGIQSVSVSASIPGMWIAKAKGIYRSGQEEENDLIYHTLGVDYDFLSTYALQFVAGRNFSKQHGTDDNAIVLTERAMKQLGFSSPEQALNERIVVGQNEKEVIGVVKDYHHMSLRENYHAIIFYPEWEHKEFYSLKLDEHSSQNIAGILSDLEARWKAVYPFNPFEFAFLNESFQKQYSADVKFGKIFNMFAAIAIILACLGLFGLTSFITLKRTKEIGIRKVLGSTAIQITLLFLKDIGVLFLAAALLAVPIAYVSLTSWLNQFAFRIDLTWWIFVVPLLLVVCIALLSISFQIVKAATANPVTSLKCE